MKIEVRFHSYFRDLAGCQGTQEEVPAGTSLGALLDKVRARYPRLQEMARSTLVAVGVDYQPREYILQDGDEVSLFPPVQGG